MKRIQCGDLVPGCGFTAQATSVAEVLSVELDHARQAHNLVVSPQFLQRARDRIEDVEMETAGEVRRGGARRG